MKSALLAMAFISWSAAAAASPDSALDEALAPLQGERPGCAAGVIRDGQLAYRKGFGLADLESRRPITATTPFNIASLSKQFTGAVAAQMIGQGLISGDDDIRKYLPELRDYGRTIRIRDLLQHSSGLRNHMALAAFQPGGGLPTNDEALALVFRQTALNFVPGTRHQYESPNYVLLAEILARVDRKPFEQVLSNRIFQPLGMRSTGFAVPHQARAYNARPNGVFELNERVNTARGSSGIVTTLEDLTRWLTALGDARFGGARFLKQMTSGGRLADGTVIDYGYGLVVTRDPSRPDALMISHGGQTAAYRSTFSYFPARRFGVVLLCNASDAPLQAADAAIAQWRQGSGLAVTAAEPAAKPLAAGAAARFAGHYHDPITDSVRTFVFEDGALKLRYFGQAYPLTHVGRHRFALDADINFTFSPKGEAMSEREPRQPPVRFTRLPAPGARPTIEYAGSYRSPDIDSLIALAPAEDALLLKLNGREVRLQRIHPDGFAAPEADFVHVNFRRDQKGKVTGLALTTSSGINRMRFDRVP